MRAQLAFAVPLAFGFSCTSTLAQTATSDVVERIAHIGDESVPLHITRAPPPNFPASVRNDKGMPGGFFAPLAADARAGDDLAAQYLWQSLMLCRNVPSTPVEQREKLDAVKSDYALTGGHGNTLQQDLDQVEARFRRCEGINESSFVEALALLRDAADHGTSAFVMLYYAQAIAKDQPEEARRRYESLWSDGHLAALAGLAGYSLAYRIASDAATIAFIDDGQHPGALPAFRVHSEKLRNETSPSEYNEAAKKAVELLRSPKCCISP